MEQNYIHHDLQYVTTVIPPVAVIYDGVSDKQQGGRLPSPQPDVEVKLTIRCRKKETYIQQKAGVIFGESTILEQTEEDKETTLMPRTLLLSDLKCIHLSLMFLSPALSNLEIELHHQNDVIAKVMRRAHEVEAEIEKERNRRALLVPIIVNVTRSIIQWLCLKCMNDIWRIRSMKDTIKGSRKKETIKSVSGMTQYSYELVFITIFEDAGL
ncbi:hypothetical protein L484_021110 [Morus notabilis]|uniref:Uncharacterized protein n=1 Tax=Morus notabilis TaxID=981085 RepID=W9RPY3_9ROSA|nr:hypothetical protein L484_021110 [Morus notabilis]